MTSSRFDLGPTSKILNLSILRIIKRSGFENLTFHHISGFRALFMRPSNFTFQQFFSLKIDPTALFVRLKIILLQYFQFLFSVFIFQFQRDKFYLNRELVLLGKYNLSDAFQSCSPKNLCCHVKTQNKTNKIFPHMHILTGPI